MASNTSNFENEKHNRQNIDVDFASDPASGGFFNSDLKKHDDLKQMLDSSKDNLKLEAMKRIIGMVAKGRDASELFPAVVKNVVSSNLEVKKLVYVYLVRYAEEQQDLALLSISSFQRGLKDPNPLIRACALRVLSSIRVPVIVPIMLLAIKETVTDLSPYVRKTTAHAIPKLYSLDPEQKEELEKVIEKLLSDMSTLVVGSAVMAFEEVCPERIDLIHTNYRKLCCLLIDVEEWGQVIIMNMLTRYARTQFLDPNLGVLNDEEAVDRPFYDDEDEDEEETKPQQPQMDRDHRLLLTITKPLLQSRNSAVVLSVAQLYQHLAPCDEVSIVARALVRLLRSHREIQAVVLTNIASLSTHRKGMFEPFLKSFFIRSSDPTQIKILKLEVMTNIATETNISLILREFQTYIWSSDKEFVAATIQAIGRCASNIKEVTDSCLNGLVRLLSNKDELVVGESVVVVRKLLQNETVGHKDIITHMARLVDGIKMPTARASILWLLGEYCDKVPKLAPDVLRKMAKTFVNEEDIVKLQIITLATKLYLTNPKQTHLLCQYIFNLAKYDTNYDIRDRARFIRGLILQPSDKANKFSKQAKKIFLAPKPPPIQHSTFKDRDQYQMSTLSHFINSRVTGYFDLPPFPAVAPDPTVRNVVKDTTVEMKEIEIASPKKTKKEKSFYSDEESSNDEENSDSDDSETDSESSSESESSEEIKKESRQNDKIISSDNSSSETSSDSESDSSNEPDSETDSDEKYKKTELSKKPISNDSSAKSNLDLLLDLDNGSFAPETPVLTPSLGGLLTPTMAPHTKAPTPGASIKQATPFYIPTATQEILNRINGKGLSIEMRFTRSPHLYSPSMTSIELTFKNHTDQEIKEICVGMKRLSAGITMHDFAAISCLLPNASVHGTLGVNFKDTINPANFDVLANGQNFPVSITATVGELVQPVSMSDADFILNQNKLRGMHEHSGQVTVDESLSNRSLMVEKLYQYINVLQVPTTEENIIKFSGQTNTDKSLVLISLTEVDEENKSKITVNCDKMIIASMLFKQLQGIFTNN